MRCENGGMPQVPTEILVPLRWSDMDAYGHVNNVVYYSYFDTLLNRYHIDHGGLDIQQGQIIGIAVQTIGTLLIVAGIIVRTLGLALRILGVVIGGGIAVIGWSVRRVAR